MTLSPQITKLVRRWYEYVSSGHHKDQDCHWYIEIDYAYEGKPTYQAQHMGYIYPSVEDMPKRRRLVAAQEDLVQLINNAIESERDWVKEVLSSPSQWDKDQLDRAKKFNELFLDDDVI